MIVRLYKLEESQRSSSFSYCEFVDSTVQEESGMGCSSTGANYYSRANSALLLTDCLLLVI
jgi:hypothetical protein